MLLDADLGLANADVLCATLMTGGLVFDTRNALDPEVVADAGLCYVGVGNRPTPMPT